MLRRYRGRKRHLQRLDQGVQIGGAMPGPEADAQATCGVGLALAQGTEHGAGSRSRAAAGRTAAQGEALAGELTNQVAAGKRQASLTSNQQTEVVRQAGVARGRTAQPHPGKAQKPT